jgi:formate/nitrite transporter FocA (FNT family)
MNERMTNASADTGRSADGNTSLGELISNLGRDTQTLVRQEMTLAKAEMKRSAGQVGMAMAKIAAGALILYSGFLMLLWAAVFGLRESDVSWWASALIVGGAALLVGLILTLWARSQLRSANLMPTETIESMKDTGAWAKGQLS